jgi:hypothetical protein
MMERGRRSEDKMAEGKAQVKLQKAQCKIDGGGKREEDKAGCKMQISRCKIVNLGPGTRNVER